MEISAYVIATFLSIVSMSSANDVADSRNVRGTQLALCSSQPKTGYYRDGYCRTDRYDHGTHTVCAVMTDAFLTYTKSMGNDLSTPKPQYNFPGLKAGDKWCLCAVRWNQAKTAGKAPRVDLDSTNQVTLDGFGISMTDLEAQQTT